MYTVDNETDSVILYNINYWMRQCVYDHWLLLLFTSTIAELNGHEHERNDILNAVQCTLCCT